MNLQSLGLVNLAYLFLAPAAFTVGMGLLLWSWRNRLPGRSWQVVAAALCALIVVGNFLGVFYSDEQMEKSRKVQYGEIYHYYLGAKYYKELKNTQLYRCTWLGFQELAGTGHRIPYPEVLRNLAATWEQEDLGELRGHVNTRCDGQFSTLRWENFLADLTVFLEVRDDTEKWHRIMVDYGNNPPPTWNIVAGAAANLIPLTPAKVVGFVWIDLGLNLLLVPLVIWRTFGLLPAIGFLLLAGMQPLLPPGMDGAAFFRQIWLAALGLAVCALHSRKFAIAGLLLGLGTALRIFPAVFAAGAALPLLWSWRDPDARRALIRFTIGGLATGGVLLALSFMVYGPEHWRSFLTIIDSHANNLASNAIGFKRHLLSFLYNTDNMMAHLDATKFTGGRVWFEYLENNMKDFHAYALGFTTVALLVTGAISIRLKPAESALIFGTTCMFFLTSAYGYYYVFLPLFAAVWMTGSFAWRPAILLSWLVAAFLVVAWYFPFTAARLTDYYTAASNVVFAILIGIIVTAAGFMYRREFYQLAGDRQLLSGYSLLLVAMAALVAGALYTLSQA